MQGVGWIRPGVSTVFIAMSLALWGPSVAAAEPWSSPAEARSAIAACFAENPEGEASCLGAVVDPCLDIAENQTTAGMIGCSGVALEGWDALLNETYQTARRQADDGARAALRSAQRAWIAYRDAKCAVWGELYRGGSMARLLIADCLRDETARRTLDLREITAHQAL